MFYNIFHVQLYQDYLNTLEFRFTIVCWINLAMITIKSQCLVVRICSNSSLSLSLCSLFNSSSIGYKYSFLKLLYSRHSIIKQNMENTSGGQRTFELYLNVFSECFEMFRNVWNFQTFSKLDEMFLNLQNKCKIV